MRASWKIEVWIIICLMNFQTNILTLTIQRDEIEAFDNELMFCLGCSQLNLLNDYFWKCKLKKYLLKNVSYIDCLSLQD